MPRGGWLNYFRSQPGVEIPAALRLAAGAVSGAALSLSFTGLYLSIYSFVCLTMLLLAVFGARPRVAFGCGFLHAIFFVFTSVPWISTVLTVHGGLSVAGGWGILLLIAMAWGILIGTFTWAVQRLFLQSVGLACIGAPFLWVTFEFVRAHLPEISFPWNLLGYPASANLGLLQITTITGIYGLSFLVVAINSLLAWASASSSFTTRFRLTAAAAATAVLVVAAAVGQRFVPEPQAHHFARAVQLNFPEVESYPPDWFQLHAAELDEIQRISLGPAAEKPDLLVWPEAPAPFSFEDQHFAKIASALAIQFQHPFLVGAVEWKPPVDPADVLPKGHLAPYNSALLIDSQGQHIFTYDKIHLVPFGEYEPFPLIHHVVTSVSEDVGGFHKGNKYVVGQLDGNKFGVFICYEAIYAGEVREFTAAGANVLINISNDGWFGRSAAAEQHLRMVRVRAVENRRWIVRGTNNGFTVSIDPYGRIFEPLPPDVRAAVDLPYDFRTDETIYARYGDWFAWMCVIVSVILVASTFRKANEASDLVAAKA
jgi:apolipoprotein N-acyltransferase